MGERVVETYRGYTLEAGRALAAGDWENTYYSAVRESDGWVAVDSFNEGDTPAFMIATMRGLVDDMRGWDYLAPHGHRFAWDMRTLRHWGPWHPDRKRAGVLAVLHKHSADPRWADMIAPLLDAERRGEEVER